MTKKQEELLRKLYSNQGAPSEDNQLGYLRALRDVQEILAESYFQSGEEVNYEAVQSLILALSEDLDHNPLLPEINS